MQVNPGGKLPISDIIGRDKVIQRYWDVLERQGLILSAERRIGKTHITMKMRAEARSEYITIYQDLEAVHSVTELVRSIYTAVDSNLSTKTKVMGFAVKWGRLMPKRIGGLEVPSARDNWRTLLDQAFDDILNIDSEKTILIIWDEFPLMLYNLREREGDALVIELLDYLRMLRQTNALTLRFLFTGSIGLHLVIRSLQLAGNANDPVNDMYPETVPPLDQADAEILAKLLLEEMDVSPDDLDPCAAEIARNVEGFPYYIHHVVDHLQQLGRRIAPPDIDDAIETMIMSERDPAHFNYYVKRINRYYGSEERDIALRLLDVLANQDARVSTEELLNLILHSGLKVQQEDLRMVLQLLVEDHYISRVKGNAGARYEFRWTLVKRWWREARL